MWIVIVCFSILLFVVASSVDLYTKPTKQELTSVIAISKTLIKQMNYEIYHCSDKHLLSLLKQRKAVVLEIYLLAKRKGTKGSTLARLIQESKELGDEYFKIKQRL